MGTAVVFPGQGSQRPGMARDFHEAFAVSRAVFEEASEAASLDLAAICFGDGPELGLTEITQPAILTAEIAMLRAVAGELGLEASCFGGHSLGEYTALTAAGAITLADAVRLVRRRGALMQQAVPVGHGAMSAVIAEGVADRDLAPVLEGLPVDVANKNSADQVVLSGSTEGIALAEQRVSELLAGGDFQIVRLDVSAPFHSRLMRGVEPAFRSELEAVAPRVAAERASIVTSNLRGTFHGGDRADLVDALTGQISGTVDFIANMRALIGAADRIVEIGPNRPLRRFFATLGTETVSIVSVKTAQKGLAR